MEVENKSIEIKTNGKTLIIRNHILDRYISYFVKRQLDENFHEKNLAMYTMGIKFENEITLNDQTTINDFDVTMIAIASEEYGKNYCKATYSFSTSNLINVDIDLSQYAGKKITALGFTGKEETELWAYVDLSNYSLVLGADGNLTITRVDMITSDFELMNYDPSDEAHFLVHLSPSMRYAGYVRLYSVGLGYTANSIIEEYKIGEDIDVEYNDNSYELTILKSLKYDIHPSTSSYPLTIRYPLKESNYGESLYPDESIFPDENLYPLGGGEYKYIFFGYLWKFAGDESGLETVTHTVKYNNDYGHIKIKTLYEREV